MPATCYWLAKAKRQSQLVTVQITLADAATTYSIQIGVNTVSVPGQASETLTASALASALSGSLAEEFREINWISDADWVYGTATNPGRPFTATSAATGGGGTMGMVGTAIANSSPNDLTNPKNWSNETLPVTGDSLVFEKSREPVLWNLNGFAGMTFVSCIVRRDMAAMCLPQINPSGYVEYRPTEFVVPCATLLVNQPPELGAESMKFNTDVVACTATFNGNGGGTLGAEVIWWRGMNAANVLNNNGASLVVACLESHTAQLVTGKTTFNSIMRFGPGTAAITTLTMTGTLANIRSNVGTLLIEGGTSELTCAGSMTVGTFTIYAGLARYDSNGAITTLNLGSQSAGGRIDFSGDKRPVVITGTINAYVGSAINDPDSRINQGTGPVVIKVTNGRLTDIAYDFGANRTHSIT